MSDKKYEAIELDLDDRTLAGIALYAHKHDITINDAICRMLEEEITKREHGAVDQRQSQFAQNECSIGSNPIRAI